jgi:hypothetical protein
MLMFVLSYLVILYFRSLCSGCSLLLTVNLLLCCMIFMPSRTFTILPEYGRVHTPVPATGLQQYIELHLPTLTQNTNQLNIIANNLCVYNII